MDSIVTEIHGTPTSIVVAIVSPLAQRPARFTAAANRNGYAVKRMEAIKCERYPGVNLVPVVVVTRAGLVLGDTHVLPVCLWMSLTAEESPLLRRGPPCHRSYTTAL